MDRIGELVCSTIKWNIKRSTQSPPHASAHVRTYFRFRAAAVSVESEAGAAHVTGISIGSARGATTIGSETRRAPVSNERQVIGWLARCVSTLPAALMTLHQLQRRRYRSCKSQLKNFDYRGDPPSTHCRTREAATEVPRQVHPRIINNCTHRARIPS